MACDGRHKLVLRAAAPPLLYDLAEDPHETVDIAAAQPQALATLGEALRAAGLGGAAARRVNP
jgi:hypothetical protein